MDDLHSSYLLGLLIFLILCSAFFSSSETGMLSLNRYRLKHMAKEGHRGAKRVSGLLSRPDRLLGTILVGNNVVNILAASIATVLAVDIWGEAGIAIATAGLTIVVLIFGEITPKTLAALRPELVAFPASRVLLLLQRLLYPVVWATSTISNVLLRLLEHRFGELPEAVTAHVQRLSLAQTEALVNHALGAESLAQFVTHLPE